MRATPAIDVNHTSRRIISALAGLAVAVTVLRFAIAHHAAQRDAAAASERPGLHSVSDPVDRPDTHPVDA